MEKLASNLERASRLCWCGAESSRPLVDADSRTRITVRNLRIREDTAKYLYNLDPKSAYYDPKSRSMRDNPFVGTNKTVDEVPFAGENFVRFSGEVTDVNEAQLFAWEAQKRGVDLHTLAEPTKLETLRLEYTDRKTTVEGNIKSSILEKYGGSEHLGRKDRDILMGQSERYVEYNRKGAVIKGEEKVDIKSRYIEDFYSANHTSVWGSYWADGRWGYDCCHAVQKNAYCTGKAGVAAGKAADVEMIQGAVKEETERGSQPLSKVDLVRVTLDDRFSGASSSTVSSSTKIPHAAPERPPEVVTEPEATPEVVTEPEATPGATESSSSGSESDDTSESESDDDEELEAARKRYEEERVKKEVRRERRRRKRDSQKQRRGDGKRRKVGAEKGNVSIADDSIESSSDSEGDQEEATSKEVVKKTRKDLIKEAIAKQQQQEAKAGRLLDEGGDERGFAYNSRYDEGGELNEIDMEAYQVRKIHQSDPMASYMSGKRVAK